MHDKIFDENSLREAIVSVWGEYGAHAEVYDMLLKKLNELQTPPSDAEMCEAVVRLREDERTGEIHHGDGMFPVLNPQRWSTCLSADLYILLRAVQSPRLTGEQMEVVRMLYGMAGVHGVFRDEPGQELECVVRAAFPEAFAGEVGRG